MVHRNKLNIVRQKKLKTTRHNKLKERMFGVKRDNYGNTIRKTGTVA